ncbi:MAG: T9SS type A sorting domain-containing protein [candidate division FCPU426 bacterium]
MHMQAKISTWFIAGLWVLYACGAADGAWTQLGSSLNINSNQSGLRPRIAIYNNQPYVTWHENNPSYPATHIYVKQWNGSNWVQVGGALNFNVATNASYPSIACSGSHQYVAWIEGSPSQTYVSGWNGTGWTSGTNLNVNGANTSYTPEIEMLGESPYVTWRESSDVYMKFYNGTDWQQLGSGAINTKTSAFYPRVAFRGTTPLDLFYEESSLTVKQYTGGNWDFVHGAVNNFSTGLGMGGIATSSIGTYVTWFEGSPTQILVKVDYGSAWEAVGGTLNVDPLYNAYNPRIALVSNTPYVTWYEYSAIANQVYVKYYNGTSASWQNLGGSLNGNTSNAATTPDIAISNSGVYVVWCENDGVAQQVYVKYWDFPAPIATPTPTSIPSPTPTPWVHGGLSKNSSLAYPNPAANRVTVSFWADSGSGEAVVRFYNTHYRLVAQASGTATDGQGEISLDISGMAPGVYFYQVMTGGTKLPMGRVVVAR